MMRTIVVCLLFLLLFLLVAAVYGQTLTYESLEYDDPHYLAKRHVKAGLSWSGILWSFTTWEFANWHPLTWQSLMLDTTLFGTHPRGYHLSNLLIHAGTVIVVWHWVGKATGSVGLAAWVAAAFATHPLHAESVSWIAERKGLLSTFFGMLAVACYLRYAAAPSAMRYACVVAAFVASLCSKQMLVTLPALLLILDWWPLRRFAGVNGRATLDEAPPRFSAATPWRSIAEKLPLLGLAAAFAVMAYLAQGWGAALRDFDTISGSQRLANALCNVPWYIERMLAPIGLCVHYPLVAPSAVRVMYAVVFILIVSSLAIVGRRRWPFVAMGWCWYLTTLAPVSGLIQIGDHARADRYSDVPLIGLYLAVGAGVAASPLPRRVGSRPIAAAAGIVVVMLAALAHRQSATWRDSVSLFEQAIAVTARNHMAHHNLSAVLRDRGELAKAFQHSLAALGIKKTAQAHIVLGGIYAQMDRPDRLDKASQCFHLAIALDPNRAEPFNDLGVIALERSQWLEAARLFEKSLRIDPFFVFARRNLGDALLHAGRPREAEVHLRQALDMTPDDPLAQRLLRAAQAAQSHPRQ